MERKAEVTDPNVRRGKIYEFISGRGSATWAQIHEHFSAAGIIRNPNTLNYDLSRLRFGGWIWLGQDNVWRPND